MTPVYCKNCKYLDEVDWIEAIRYRCYHPKNVNTITEWSWLDGRTSTEAVQSCKSINRNNDCEWFEPKPLGFWSKLFGGKK